MAFIIPRNPTLIESLGQGLEQALPGLVAGGRSRANQQLAIQQGLGDVPFGASPQLLAALLSKQGVGGAFTLTPGAQRFDAQGNPIASVPTDTEQDPFTLTPGGQRFDVAGNVIASLPPIAPTPRAPTPFKVVDKLVDDPASPTGFSVEQFDQTGKSIGRRNATRKEVLQGVPEGALQKGTKTKIEKDIIDLNSTLAELDAIEKQINPDFFTFRGKGAAFFTALSEKLEIPVPQAAKEFLSAKTKFFADSKRVFLKFRKFITGVAGGITEFKEIQKAAIDPEGDSETEFKAKMKSMRDNVTRTKNVLLAIRNSGLNPNNPADRRQVFKGLSLKSIPLEVPPNVTLDTLQGQQGLTPNEEAEFQQLLLERNQ